MLQALLDAAAAAAAGREGAAGETVEYLATEAAAACTYMTCLIPKRLLAEKVLWVRPLLQCAPAAAAASCAAAQTV
jgi:hypothetical protein